MKYNEIVKCNFRDFKNNKIIYKNCYLLTYKGCEPELEIDLISDLWFNTEFKATDKKLVKRVNNVEELLDFIEKEIASVYKNCDYMKDYILKRYEDNELACGGAEDYILNYDLSVNRCL